MSRKMANDHFHGRRDLDRNRRLDCTSASHSQSMPHVLATPLFDIFHQPLSCSLLYEPSRDTFNFVPLERLSSSSATIIPQPVWIAQENRKRQRRQTAGNLVVSSFFNRNGAAAASATVAAPPVPVADAAAAAGAALAKTNKKKQSTAQPRPKIAIEPKQIGPIFEPSINDVLSGRGGRINAHSGNVQFREIVAQRKTDYLAKDTKKLQKAHIAAEIVDNIRNMEPSGRFLKEDPDGSWWDIGDAKAIKKVGQALREDSIEARDLDLDGEDDIERKNSFDGPKNNEAVKSNMTMSGMSAAEVTPIQANRTMNTTSTNPSSKNTSSIPMPPLTTSGSSVSGSPTKSATAVSSRGGKLTHSNSGNNSHGRSGHCVQQVQQTSQQNQPVSFQIDIGNQTVAQSTTNTPFYPNLLFRGMGTPRAAVSGAAAAAMKQQQQSMHEFEVPASRHEEAFGRTFHSPPDQNAESSMISGVSLTPSGMSGISALTDPISALAQSDLGPSRVVRQTMQLDSLRQNWTAQPTKTKSTGESGSGTVQMLNSSHVKQQHGAMNQVDNNAALNVRMEQQRRSMDDAMSWAGNSLQGGGLSVRENSVFGGGGVGGSVCSVGNDSFGVMLADLNNEDFITAGDVAPASSAFGSYHGNDHHNNANQRPAYQHNNNQIASSPAHPRSAAARGGRSYFPDGASVTSMSITSAGVSSLPSIGDLSEGLSALDLASYNYGSGGPSSILD